MGILAKIRNNTQTKTAKVILGIIIVPFALFGIDSYLSSVGSNVYVATRHRKDMYQPKIGGNTEPS